MQRAVGQAFGDGEQVARPGPISLTRAAFTTAGAPSARCEGPTTLPCVTRRVPSSDSRTAGMWPSEDIRRHQARGSVRPFRLNRRQRDSLFHGERSRLRPSKRGEVTAAPERQAEVVRERPYVEAGAAHHPEAHQIVRTREQRELVNRHLRQAATRRTVERARPRTHAAPRPSWPNTVAASAGTSLESDPARRRCRRTREGRRRSPAVPDRAPRHRRYRWRCPGGRRQGTP